LPGRLPLLEKGAERRDPGARPDHDHRAIRGRQAKRLGRMDIDCQFGAGRDPVAQERRGDTGAPPPPLAVAHRGDGQMDFALGVFGRRCDRVEDLHAAPLSAKRLLALWNALPCVEKRKKVGDRDALIDQLWSAIEALPDPEPQPDPKPPSKQDVVIAMLRLPEGATVDEVASVTGWQRHTVRGVFSGTLKKKLGLTLASAKEERGRVYRIADPANL
jgi:hypothetical protein